MPVRNSTAWQHAIIHRKIINHDRGGTYVMCAWDTCERAGYQNFSVRTHQHKPGAQERYMNYVFCTERHKQAWLQAIVPGSNNCLPPGYRLAVT